MRDSAVVVQMLLAYNMHVNKMLPCQLILVNLLLQLTLDGRNLVMSTKYQVQTPLFSLSECLTPQCIWQQHFSKTTNDLRSCHPCKCLMSASKFDPHFIACKLLDKQALGL